MTKLENIIISDIVSIYRDSESGGALHIVLGDGNCEDHHIQWCLENSIQAIKDPEKKVLYSRCANNLLKLKESRRHRIISYAWSLYKNSQQRKTTVYQYKVDMANNTVSIRKQQVTKENALFLMVSPTGTFPVSIYREDLDRLAWPQGYATSRQSARRLVRQALNRQVEVLEEIIHNNQILVANTKTLIKNL